MFLEKKLHHILNSIGTIKALALPISNASAGINESIENALKLGQEDGNFDKINTASGQYPLLILYTTRVQRL